jgi:starvation-inducible outer membrane lipoprotein
MTRTGIVAERLSLVTTKCANCGTVDIRWNGTVVKTFNLYSRTTLRKQVLGITSFTTPHSGTLTVTNTSATGKAIYIEGVAVYNTH